MLTRKIENKPEPASLGMLPALTSAFLPQSCIPEKPIHKEIRSIRNCACPQGWNILRGGGVAAGFLDNVYTVFYLILSLSFCARFAVFVVFYITSSSIVTIASAISICSFVVLMRYRFLSCIASLLRFTLYDFLSFASFVFMRLLSAI